VGVTADPGAKTKPAPSSFAFVNLFWQQNAEALAQGWGMGISISQLEFPQSPPIAHIQIWTLFAWSPAKLANA